MGSTKKDCWFKPVDIICILFVLGYILFFFIPHAGMVADQISKFSGELSVFAGAALGFYIREKSVKKE